MCKVVISLKHMDVLNAGNAEAINCDAVFIFNFFFCNGKQDVR